MHWFSYCAGTIGLALIYLGFTRYQDRPIKKRLYLVLGAMNLLIGSLGAWA